MAFTERRLAERSGSARMIAAGVSPSEIVWETRLSGISGLQTCGIPSGIKVVRQLPKARHVSVQQREDTLKWIGVSAPVRLRSSLHPRTVPPDTIICRQEGQTDGYRNRKN
jgi:hypothetical protein